jgi:hypothetical protein
MKCAAWLLDVRANLAGFFVINAKPNASGYGDCNEKG